MSASRDLAERIVSVLLGERHGKREGAEIRFTCPAHDDEHPSARFNPDKAVWICDACKGGSGAADLARRLGLTKGKKRGGGVAPSYKTHATAQPRPTGCRLEEYAQAKGLPLRFLLDLGLTEMSLGSAPALRIPYFAADGTEAAVRFRVGLDAGGSRFKWRSGSKPLLYGLSRLKRGSRLPADAVLLVEGESDAHTLWFHDFRGLGIPGASNWREDRDAPHFDPFSIIYIVVERDAGGEAMVDWLSRSRIRDRVRLVDLGDAKDPSALYLSDRENFVRRFEELMSKAVPFVEIDEQKRTAARSEDAKLCATVSREPAILDRVVRTLKRLGVVGEERLAKLVFLVLTSRHLERPVSGVVKGPSAAGKSYVAEKVLALFDPSSYYALTAMSERALAYGEEPLDHRFIVLFEAAGMGEMGAYLVRSLLSEGRICYETVEKTAEGLKKRRIERQGPTGLLVTTTALKLHPENETRLFSIPVNDSVEQTREILRALATRDGATKFDASEWHALDRWLSGSPSVLVPFAQALAEKTPACAVRLRRDFGAVLNLIQAHALLHQQNRGRDEAGRILATVEDYATVRELVADLIAQGVETAVPVTVREAVDVVEGLAPRDSDIEVTVAKIAGELKLDKASASRRVSNAVNLGYLKNLEEKKGRPARIVLGDPLPTDLEILPHPAELESGCTVAPDPDQVDTPPPSPESQATAAGGDRRRF